MAHQIKKEVRRLTPEVVHAHNTFPLISPSIFSAVAGRSARVLTLHNYRLFCPAAIPVREGEVCTECISRRNVWPALKHGCYRNSRIATVPLALSVGLHRTLKTWLKHIDAFIVLTEFQRGLVIEAGLPSELVHVKPNFYPGHPLVVPWRERRPVAVYVGRLSEEKGVADLIRAWKEWGGEAPELRIIGDGRQRKELEKIVGSSLRLPIRFLGQLSHVEAQAEIANSRLLILPSNCYEGFPMVIREAFAFGTPAAVSGIGALPSIVSDRENGVVFSPGDPSSLYKIVRSAWDRPEELEKLALNARCSFEKKYTEEVNYQLLMDIYSVAKEVSLARG